MPEGLPVKLSRDQFADLIAYLESLRSAGPADARQRVGRAGDAPARASTLTRSPAG